MFRSLLTRRTLLHLLQPKSSINRGYSKHDPNYLDLLKPKFPQYETVNFRITGYDYPVLESYQKFVHNTAEYMGFEVPDAWAVPPKKLKVQRYKPQSTVVDSEYHLSVYERIVQIDNLDAPLYPTFLRLIQAGLPEGVTLEVLEHTDDQDEIRFVPDSELLELKSQLEEMRKPKK
uniref:Small ribosomal subunit protein uS10 domain-containing protein n=1 Tax=Lutzomyia longipalpis TaxID=7200 RepID=A0A1B0GKG9_LUTLO